MKRLSIALFLFLLLLAYGSASTPALGRSLNASTAYCTPNYTVAPLPNTQSGNFNSTNQVCFVVQNAGPLGFNCSNMQGRSVTVNGTSYSSSACTGSVAVPNTNDGQYYFDVSAGGLSYASIAFWAGSGSGGSGGTSGSCTATLSAGQSWSDRYNLNVSVTGSDNWRVKMTLPSSEVMLATWNIDPYWPPPGNMLIAAPNGSGNNWGVTIKPNGNWTWPTVTCEAFDEPPSVHVKVVTCPSFNPDEHILNQCATATGYALTGGGAYAEYTGAGAFLTESWPEPMGDTRWWVAASQDLVQTDNHMLTIYAIGLRLDGVNTARLNSLISLNNVTFPPGSTGTARPTGELGIGPMTLGGGADTFTNGEGQFLNRAMADGNLWKVASKNPLVSSPGWITATTLTLADGIIEGFGALQVRQVKAAPATVQSGVGTSTGYVTPGWSLVSLGGEALTTGGLGRMLFRIGIDQNASTVTVQSKDHLGASAGITTASWIEVRKAPGSHGMCSVGTALLPSMDACVASICSVDSHCCQNGWDSSCVAQVTSVCGRSCEDYSCSAPAYNPDYWNDWDENGVNGAQWLNNCYNYATNTRTDTNAQPGKASGRYCVGRAGCALDMNAEFAVNDGLIPTTLAAGCPDNRSMVALFGSAWDDYHWYRQDSDGTWSHKRGYDPATNLDASGNVITDIENFDTGDYPTFGGYFCTCSSSTEGDGHAEIE